MELGTCPVCEGTTRIPAGDRQHKNILAGYDSATDTLQCMNCGGQRMFGRATGQVPLNRNGEPCRHQYRGETIGRCLTRYTCSECGDRHEIDSGD